MMTTEHLIFIEALRSYFYLLILTICMSALAAAATTSYAGSRRHDHDTSYVLLPPFYHFLPSSLICMATFLNLGHV